MIPSMLVFLEEVLAVIDQFFMGPFSILFAHSEISLPLSDSLVLIWTTLSPFTNRPNMRLSASIWPKTDS